MSAASSFDVDPNNFLGLDAKTFKNTLYRIALSKPNTYFKIRQDVETKLKKQVIANMYQNIKTMLSEGVIDGQQVIFDENGNPLRPNMPEQVIVNHNLGLARTLNEALDSIIEELLPLDFERILKGKLIGQGNASIV